MGFFDELRKYITKQTGENPAFGNEKTPGPEELERITHQPATVGWTMLHVHDSTSSHKSTCSARGAVRLLIYGLVVVGAVFATLNVVGFSWLKEHEELRELKMEKKTTTTVIEVLREKGLLSEVRTLGDPMYAARREAP